MSPTQPRTPIAALKAASARYDKAKTAREDAIRAARACGASYAQIAAAMGITRAGAQDAVRRAERGAA